MIPEDYPRSQGGGLKSFFTLPGLIIIGILFLIWGVFFPFLLQFEKDWNSNGGMSLGPSPTFIMVPVFAFISLILIFAFFMIQSTAKMISGRGFNSTGVYEMSSDSPTVTFCKSCGTRLMGKPTFCPECGTKLE